MNSMLYHRWACQLLPKLEMKLLDWKKEHPEEQWPSLDR